MLLARLLALIALCAFATTPAQAGGPATFEEALALAEAEDKPVVIDFFADWCGPCKRFTADYEADAAAQSDFAEKAVLFKIDAEKGDGVGLAARFNVSAYPNFVAVNAEGAEIDRWVGYGDLDTWMEQVDAVAADPVTLRQRVRRFRTEPTADDGLKIGKNYDAQGLFGEALAYFRRVQQLDPTAEGLGTEIFGAISSGAARRGLYTGAEVVAAAEEALAGANVSDETTRDIVYQVYQAARGLDRIDLYVPFIERGLAATEGVTEPWPVMMRNNMLVHEALYVKEDGALAFARRKDAAPEGWADDPAQLNSIAWWCFENEVALEEGQDLAQRGVELAQDDGQKANILDTLAELCNLAGDCGQALEYMRQAVALAPDNEHFQEQIERFEAILAAQG